MNTKTLNWIILAVVVVCAIAYIASLPRGGGQAVTTSSTTTPSTASSAKPVTQGAQTTSPSPVKKPAAVPSKLQGIGTMANLFDLQKPFICSMTTRGTVKSSGSLYVAERKFRVNFPTTSMINDGSYLYLWKTGATKGLKLLAASSVSGSAMAANGGFDPGLDISFSCSAWTENASFFVPPSSVVFANTL